MGAHHGCSLLSDFPGQRFQILLVFGHPVGRRFTYQPNVNDLVGGQLQECAGRTVKAVVAGTGRLDGQSLRVDSELVTVSLPDDEQRGFSPR